MCYGEDAILMDPRIECPSLLLHASTFPRDLAPSPRDLAPSPRDLALPPLSKDYGIRWWRMLSRGIQGKQLLFLSDLPFHAGQLQHFTRQQFEYTMKHREQCATLSQQMELQWAFLEDWKKEVRLQLHHVERVGGPNKYRFRLV